MGEISSTDKLDLLYKKYLGYTDIADIIALELDKPAYDKLYSNAIYNRDIPSSAPSNNTVTNITVQYKYLYNSINTDTISYKKSIPINDEHKHVVKYSDVTLYKHPFTNHQVYYYADLSNNINLLQGCITTKHSHDNSYSIQIKNSLGEIFAPSTYIIDSDVGYVRFYIDTDTISAINPPKITFWRYEGPVGLGYDASNVYLGTNAALINQQPNAIAIGTNAGRDTQGSNAIAIGANAGYTSQHANSIILNASDASLNSLTPGFFVNPIREIDTTAGTITPISYYNPITKEIQYGKNTWYSVPAASAIDMSGNQILRLAEPTDPSGATTKSYVDTAISNISTYLANSSTAWYNIRAGTNVDLSANRIINLSEPIDLSGAATKYYVDNRLDASFNEIRDNIGDELAIIDNSLNVINTHLLTLDSSFNDLSGQLTTSVQSINTHIDGSYNDIIQYVDSSLNTLKQYVDGSFNTINSRLGVLDISYNDLSGQLASSVQLINSRIDAAVYNTNIHIGRHDILDEYGQPTGITESNSTILHSEPYTVAIGYNTAVSGQQIDAIAIGNSAGNTCQSSNAIAIGRLAGNITQGLYSVAIGNEAAISYQGDYSIAIGNSAGKSSQFANSIILNASPTELNSSTSGLFINPIRQANLNINTLPTMLTYNTTTNEVNYSSYSWSAYPARVNINMNSKKITNLADPSNEGDAVSKGYLDNTLLTYLDTVSTNIGTASLSNLSTLQNSVNDLVNHIDLSYNDLSGQLASSVQSINTHIDSSYNAIIQYIDSSFNDIRNNIGGELYSIDSSLNNINAYLVTLDASFNDLSGQLASSVQLINSHIDASYNSTITYIDNSISTVTTHLTALDASYNTLKQYTDGSFNTVITRIGTLDASYNTLKQYVDSSLNNLTTYIDNRVGSSITTIPNWSTVQASTTPDLSNNRITNVADPSNNQDVATKNYVDTKVNPLDQWLSTYLLSQPPAIDVSNNFIPTSSEIGFFWTLPQQISVAFSQQKFPVINELYADISGVEPIFTSQTSKEYVPGTSYPVTLLILSKTNSNPGYQQRTIGGKTYNAYVYYSPLLSTAGSTIYVTVYYKNSSSQQPNKVTVPLATFMQGYPPSAVRSISATASTTSAVVQWTAPQYIDTTPGNQKTYGTAGAAGYATPSYTLTYQPTASSKYGGISGLVNTTNTQNYSATTQSYNQTGLYAGTSYKVTITAKNDVSSTPSPDASGTFTTTLPPPSNLISAYSTIPFAGNYSRSSTIQNVSNTVLTTSDLIFYNSGTDFISSISPLTIAVTNESNPGSSTAMTLSYDASNNLTVGGFPSFTVTPQGRIASGITPGDVYSDASQNNLMGKVTFTLQLALPSPAAAQKTSTLTHTINGSTVSTKSYTYYVDSLPTTAQASISAEEDMPTYTTSSLTRKLICGIPIYGTTASQQLRFNNIKIVNQGKYFYYQGKLFTVSVDLMGINSSIGTLPASPLDASGAIKSPLTYPITNVTGSFSASSYSKGMSYTITPFNINNLSTPLTASVPIIVDGPTANKAFPSSEASPAGSTEGVEGMRFSNPVDLTSTSLALAAFNHSTSIATNLELLYADGKYRYKEATQKYLFNYSTLYGGPDYSNLSGTTRYATFSWTVSNSYASQISNLKFKISNLKSGMITGINSQTKDIVSSGIDLYYKFQEFNSSGQPIPITDSSSKTTVWINAFQVNNAAINASYYQNSTNNQSGGFNLTNSTLTDPTHPIIGVNGWSFKPTDILTGHTLKIYVRVGFSASATDAVFSQINCSYT